MAKNKAKMWNIPAGQASKTLFSVCSNRKVVKLLGKLPDGPLEPLILIMSLGIAILLINTCAGGLQ